jgi:N-carbamoylputrescine amidase
MNTICIAWMQGKYCNTLDDTIIHYESLFRSIKGSTDLVILPELVFTPYFPFEENMDSFKHAIEITDPIFTLMADWAKQKEAVLVFPFFEKRAPGIYHNSAVIFERDGSIVHHYRKTHIPDDPGFYEKYYFAPGDSGIHAVQTSAGKIGLLICWDQWFPEAARLHALQGAEILIYPTAIGWDVSEDQALYPKQQNAWETMIKSHAIANGIFSCAVNRVGTENQLQFWGHSLLCAPDGSLMNTPTSDSGVYEGTIDLKQIQAHRHAWPHIRDRRYDLYQPLTKFWIDS